MFVTTAYALSATAATEAAAPAEGETHNTTTTAVHEVEHEAAFPPFDATHFPSQILWLAITFGVFYFLVSKMIAPRISGIIEARESRIASDLAEASRMKNEADAAVGAQRLYVALGGGMRPHPGVHCWGDQHWTSRAQGGGGDQVVGAALGQPSQHVRGCRRDHQQVAATG